MGYSKHMCLYKDRLKCDWLVASDLGHSHQIFLIDYFIYCIKIFFTQFTVL